MSRRAFAALCAAPVHALRLLAPAVLVVAVCSGSIINVAFSVLLAAAFYGTERKGD